MKSAVYLGKEQVEVRMVEDPVCGPDDVVVENRYASICGTDVAVYAHGPNTGHKVTVGGEFGHEAVSRVIEVGAHVTDFKVGDRVYPYPLYARGDTSRAGTMGAFSERMLIPHATRDRELYLVPDAIDDRCACLIEPFTVGGHAAMQAHPMRGEHAIVYGCGTIGLAAAIRLAWAGAAQVLVCDFSDFRLNIARGLGFATCNNAREDPYEVAQGLFGTAYGLQGATADVDIFIDAAGAPQIMDDFMARAKVDARMVCVAVSKGARTVDILSLVYASKTIAGSGGYRPQDVCDAMDIMASGRWDIASLITQEFALDDIDEALRCAADTDRALNVVIDMKR